MAQSQITLSISEANAAGKTAYTYHVLVNGTVVASNRTLTPSQTQDIRSFSRTFARLFEQRLAPQLALTEQQSFGDILFRIWLADVWPQVEQHAPPGTPRTLVIASTSAPILNLPWELVRLPSGAYLGFEPTLAVRRLPRVATILPAFTGALAPRPLRILFLACAPQDQAQLDYEREEEALLSALPPSGPDVAIDSGDLGTFEELRDRIHKFPPYTLLVQKLGLYCRIARSSQSPVRCQVD